MFAQLLAVLLIIWAVVELGSRALMGVSPSKGVYKWFQGGPQPLTDDLPPGQVRLRERVQRLRQERDRAREEVELMHSARAEAESLTKAREELADAEAELAHAERELEESPSSHRDD